MKIFRLLLVTFSLAAVLQACSTKEDMPQETLPGITLRFSTGDGFELKSETKPGEDPWNENLLSSVEYFLYPDGKTNQNAVFHGYLENVTKRAPYNIPMTDIDVRNTLCPGNSKYFEVYVIANHDRVVHAATPGSSEDLTGTSVATLESLTRELDIVALSGENVVSNQSNFLMSTDGALRVGPIKKAQTTVAEATVDLKRVAAKLSIVVRIIPQVIIPVKTTIGEITIDREEIWEPRMNESTIYLVNGALDGQVSGEPLDSPTLYEHLPIYFDLSKSETHSFSEWKLRTNVDGDPVDEHGNVIDENNDVDPIYDEVTGSGSFYPAKTPFYSYPQKWSYGSDTEPYLKLVVPWDRVEYVEEGGGTVRKVRQSKQYYYRVYCPGTTGDGETCDAEFVRNNWYKVILNVGILGSETDGGEIIINGTYFIADWQERSSGEGGESGTIENDSDKEAEIKGARYLFVNKEEYYLYNINDLKIPYTTSDPCELIDFTGKRYTFSGSSKTPQEITNKANWSVTLDLSSEGGAHIVFNHALDNNLDGTTYDVSEYEFHFRLRQISNTDYYKDIVIYQRPSIVIDMEDNSSGTHYGYTYVNDGTVNPTGYGSLGTNGSSSGTNTNFNMFTIETTVLPSDSDFMLGDPRVMTIDNINPTNWPTTKTSAVASWSANTANIQSNTNRQLTYYYPVDNSSNADNIIAPKFRVASSHGATGTVTYANAFRRCASYQEKGYPAGRWRLPTMGEISYITKLNADGKIARLFGSNTNGETTNYWCNSGYIMVYDGTNAASKQAPVPHPGETGGDAKYVRCVYDDWYWDGMKIGNTDVSTVTPLGTFKWGDMPR